MSEQKVETKNEEVLKTKTCKIEDITAALKNVDNAVKNMAITFANFNRDYNSLVVEHKTCVNKLVEYSDKFNNIESENKDLKSKLAKIKSSLES